MGYSRGPRWLGSFPVAPASPLISGWTASGRTLGVRGALTSFPLIIEVRVPAFYKAKDRVGSPYSTRFYLVACIVKQSGKDLVLLIRMLGS